METGICWIKFEEKVDDDKIEEIISRFYLDNEKYIKGMVFSQPISEEVFDKARKSFHESSTIESKAKPKASHNKDYAKKNGGDRFE